jgi:hypothetical protein
VKILIEFKHPRGTVREVKVNNETWILHGECNRCGDCCEVLDASVIKLLKQKDSKKCKHLGYENFEGKRIAKCAIIWERPAFCVFYPRDPSEPLFPNCSFRWEKLNGR